MPSSHPPAAGLARRTLIGAALLTAFGCTTGRGRGAHAAPVGRMSDEFSAAADGVLDGRISPTGHRWRVSGIDGRSSMVVRDGAFGASAGHVPGGPAMPGRLPTAAGYAAVELGGPSRLVEAEYRWDRSSSVATGLALGAFDVVPDDQFPGTRGGASAHLAVTPAFLQFAVFSRGVYEDFTVLTPSGTTNGTVFFPIPQACDGVSVYRARIALLGDTARVTVDGLPAPLLYRDPRIAAVPASTPFWEYFSVPGGTNLPRFVRVAAARS